MTFSWWRRFLSRKLNPVRRSRRSPGAKPWRAFRPIIEDLEGRLVPATVRFTNPLGGDWQTASNWSTGSLPGRLDDVVLDLNVPVTFSGSDPGVEVHSITQRTGSLTITGGKLAVDAPSTFNGALTLNGPTADLGIFGDLNDHGRPGQLTLNGTLTWNSGTIHGGTFAISASGSANVTGVFGEMYLGRAGEATAMFNNAGTVRHTGSGNSNGFLLMDNAVINNQAGGTYTFSGDYGINIAITPTGTTKLMTNSGTVRHAAGMGNAIVGVPLNNMTGGLLDVQAGTVTFTGGGAGLGGAINVNAGAVIDLTGNQLPIYSGTYTATGAGTIRVQNGTLTANGATFNFPSGMFQWTGGTIQGTGLTNAGFMTLAYTTPDHPPQILGGNLYNTGTITDNNSAATTLFVNHGTLYNQAGATFNILNDSSILRVGTLPPFQIAPDLVTSIYNSGTFGKTGGAGTSTVNVLFNNSPGGTVNTASGSLFLKGGGTSSGGTFNATNGALIDFSFDPPIARGLDPSLFRGYQNMTGTYNGSGNGTVRLSVGRIGVQGADLTFNFAPGLFQWTGGTIDTGVQNLYNRGAMNLAGMTPSTPPTLTGTLNNFGTISETGTVSLQMASGTLNNEAGTGVIDFQSEGGVSVLPNSDGNVTNYGLITKTAGTESDILAPYNNQVGGGIDVEAGTLVLGGGGNSVGGIFNAGAGGVLDLTGGNTNQFLSGTYTGSGAGTVRLASGTLNAGQGAQLVFNFAPGLFQWQGGTLNTGSRDLANQGFLTISGSQTATLTGTLNNTGTLTQAGPALLLNNGYLNNLPGGVVDIQSEGGAFSASGTSLVNNAGMFQKSTGISSGINAPFNTPGGSVLAASGTLAFNLPVTQGGEVLSGGTWEARNGAVLTINSAGDIHYNNATVILSGATARFTNLMNLAVNNGSLILQNGAGFNDGSDFQNAGILTLNPGSKFTVAGAYTQTPTGTTNIAIGGSSASGLFGQVTSTGAANLGGLLNISLANGFAPSPGDVYPILSFASRTGDFAAKNGLQPGRNVTLTPQYTPTSLNLVAGQAVTHTTTPLAFVIGLDNQVYAQKLDASGHPASGYFVLQIAPGVPTLVKAIATGHDAANVPLLFAIGLDNQVYVQKFTAAGDPNGVWFLAKPGSVQSITVGADAANRPELFAIGIDNQVYALQFDAAGNPGAGYYFPLQVAPGITTQVKSVAVTHDAKYNPVVFGIGIDDQVYAVKLDANGNQAGTWNLVQSGKVKAIRAGFDSFLNPELFAIGLDNQVYGQKFDANANPVGGYFLTGVGAVKALVVSHDALNNPETFVIGMDNQVYALHFDASGGPSSGYFLTNAGQVKALDVGYANGNSPEVFATGLDDNLYAFTLDGNGTPNSGYFLTQPGAILAVRVTP